MPLIIVRGINELSKICSNVSSPSPDRDILFFVPSSLASSFVSFLVNLALKLKNFA